MSDLMLAKRTLRAAMRRAWIPTFLSLDVVRAFYDMMGLEASVHEVVHSTCGAATLRTRALLVRSISDGVPRPTLEGLCDYVESSLNQEATEHLVWWLTFLLRVDTNECKPLDDWMHVLRLCHHEGGQTWQNLGLPTHISIEAATRFGAAIDMKKFYARREKCDATALSDWDLHLYASELFVFDDDIEGTGIDPFGYVAASVRASQGYRFWSWLLENLDERQQTLLRENALQLAKTEELTSVKDLVPPITLAISP